MFVQCIAPTCKKESFQRTLCSPVKTERTDSLVVELPSKRFNQNYRL